MIFCGDIALPRNGTIHISGIPQRLLEQPWIGNLEGSLVECDDNRRTSLQKRHIVFNDKEAVRALCSTIPFAAFNIANNHILDAAPLTETLDNLKHLGIPHVGAGGNLSEANKELVIDDYVILSFGWNAINCVYATSQTAGVNPYLKEHVLSRCREAASRYPSKKIICLFHWNYELEQYPQPIDREVAKKLIDSGSFAIIGCHAHRIQPVEFHNNRTIVYGMGNFIFPHSTYMNGKLKFPPFTSTEYVVEADNDTIRIHQLSFDSKTNHLQYIGELNVPDPPFANMDNLAYERWFKTHRYQKKALPIIKFTDSDFSYSSKIKWISIRNKITKALASHKKANSLIKSLLSKIYERKNHSEIKE